MWRMTEIQRTHVRRLPGGGFAAIDVMSGCSKGSPRIYHGALVIERGARLDRRGYSSSVLASARGSSAESVVKLLLPVLQNYSASMRVQEVSAAEPLAYAG